MKVKAKTTFAGNVGENDDTGFVKKGATLDVTPNRAGELLRADLVEEVATAASAAPAQAPTKPSPDAGKDSK